MLLTETTGAASGLSLAMASGGAMLVGESPRRVLQACDFEGGIFGRCHSRQEKGTADQHLGKAQQGDLLLRDTLWAGEFRSHCGREGRG